MKLKELLLVFIILVNMFLSGCSTGHEINTVGIAIAMGIDKSKNGYLVTYQVINPKAVASKNPANESPFTLYTGTGKNLLEIEKSIIEQSPREIYVSHIRSIVISESVAKKGIKDILEFIIRDPRYRGNDLYLLIARDSTANKILRVVSPLESISGSEIVDSLESSENIWGTTKSVRVVDAIGNIIEDGNNSVATGINVVRFENKATSIDSLKKTNSVQINVSRLGAFKKDKFVGWLTDNESKGYNYIMGNIQNTVGDIQYDKQNQITFQVTQAQSKTTTYLLNGKPAIKVKINVETNIAAQTGKIDLSNEDILKKVDSVIGKKIKTLCTSAIKRAKENLSTDIFGFGQEIHINYPKLWKKIKNKWNSEFTNLPVEVEVNVQTNNLGESTKSIFEKGSQ